MVSAIGTNRARPWKDLPVKASLQPAEVDEQEQKTKGKKRPRHDLDQHRPNLLFDPGKGQGKQQDSPVLAFDGKGGGKLQGVVAGGRVGGTLRHNRLGVPGRLEQRTAVTLAEFAEIAVGDDL